jgi:hypothetical protein
LLPVLSLNPDMSVLILEQPQYVVYSPSKVRRRPGTCQGANKKYFISVFVLFYKELKYFTR